MIGWIHQSQEKQAILEIGERHNSLLARSIANSIVPVFQQHLSTASSQSRKQILANPQTRILDRAIRKEVSDLSILKVKIFSYGSKTLYSTNIKDIGVIRDASYPGKKASITGLPASVLQHRDGFETLTGEIKDSYVLSTYVSIPDKQNSGKGFVVEIYTDVSSDIAAIDAAQVSIEVGSAAVLFMVLVIMFFAARRADTMLGLEVELSQQAMDSSSRLGKIIDQSSNEIYVFSADTLEFIEVNRGACQNLGYSEDELRSMTAYDIKPEYDEKSFRQAIRPLLNNEKKQLLFETVHRRKDGTTYPVEVRLQLSNIGENPMFVAMIMDITDRKAAENRISFLAYHDELTELPNRNLFLDRLQQALFDADREEHLIAVMFLDLDRFKTINDSLGHTVGDELLVQASQRLKSVLRVGDTVARLGGDEFSIVLNGISNVVDCTVIADKILGCISRPFRIGERELVVTVSIGITMYPFDTGEVHGLLKNADIAMYHAKDAGRNNFQFYSATMAETAAERLGIEMSLRHALAKEEFVLHYQPIMDVVSGEVVGVESLVRWQHPDRGLVGPDTFISIAEETGLIVPMGEWVIRTACEQSKVLEEMGLSVPRVAVNLSPRQFRDPSLLQNLQKILHETGFDPERLDLEITESLLMDDIDKVNQQLGEITSSGVKLSIDDFGTGYSSLSYLRQLPISNLKIDRSFVRELPVNEDDAAIVGSIISMAHFLGMKTIAEGVETPEQFNFLKEAGCDIVQGYWISKPLPLDELCQFVKESQNSHALKKLANQDV